SDMAVALTCLDAVVETEGHNAQRRLAIRDFHLLPGDTPHLETALADGELIVAVEIPAPPANARSRYMKVRDRASYEFALVSVGAILAMAGGAISGVRLGFGGVGKKPWRAVAVENILRGAKPSLELFRSAAQTAVAEAAPRRHNRFKVELLKRT